eukprot:1425846-Pleurochrysis_carterae.AAC.1
MQDGFIRHPEVASDVLAGRTSLTSLYATCAGHQTHSRACPRRIKSNRMKSPVPNLKTSRSSVPGQGLGRAGGDLGGPPAIPISKFSRTARRRTDGRTVGRKWGETGTAAGETPRAVA